MIVLKMKKRFGFTLLELLVVITIIGLLASVGLASYTRAQARARDAKRQSDLTTLRNALELYYSENNSYINTGGACQGVETALVPLTPNFTKALPADPGGQGLPYLYCGNAQSYCLQSKLETAETTQSTCTGALQGGGYNYGVGNP